MTTNAIPPLVVVDRGEIATLRLQNPPLNLITVEVTRALNDALASIERDDSIRVVVVTGTGDRAFCVGSDVKEFEALQGRVGEGKLLLEKAVYRRLARLPVPTIAALQGDGDVGVDAPPVDVLPDLVFALAEARLFQGGGEDQVGRPTEQQDGAGK